MRRASLRFLAGVGLGVIVWTAWAWIVVAAERRREHELNPYRRHSE